MVGRRLRSASSPTYRFSAMHLMSATAVGLEPSSDHVGVERCKSQTDFGVNSANGDVVCMANRPFLPAPVMRIPKSGRRSRVIFSDMALRHVANLTCWPESRTSGIAWRLIKAPIGFNMHARPIQYEALERNAREAVKFSRLTFPPLEGVARHKIMKNREF